MMRDRLYRRVVPAMARFFRFAPTRADRYLVSAYTAETGGHFFRHRDDVNAGARHRRFAMTLGLNKDYEGGGIVFPEFGPRPYYPPVGGALVFSTGMLHEVQPVTKGRRFVFVPFFYGEEDVAVRLANNAALAAGEARYEPGADLLAPPATTG
jgi:predicted 2-oxoglutarate/Fe(II)-dependent dioxygenase YbiX